MNIECRPGDRGYPVYQRAVRASEVVEERLERLGDSILKRPVKSWQDVVLLAELAAAQEGRAAGLASENGDDVVYQDPAHQALAALLAAVLRLGARARVSMIQCDPAVVGRQPTSPLETSLPCGEQKMGAAAKG
jgi:hypothetical protein